MKELLFEQLPDMGDILIKIESAEDFKDLIQKYVNYKKNSKHNDIFCNAPAWADILYKDDFFGRMLDFQEENGFDENVIYLSYERYNIYEGIELDDYSGVEVYLYVSNNYKVDLI